MPVYCTNSKGLPIRDFSGAIFIFNSNEDINGFMTQILGLEPKEFRIQVASSEHIQNLEEKLRSNTACSTCGAPPNVVCNRALHLYVARGFTHRDTDLAKKIGNEK